MRIKCGLSVAKKRQLRHRHLTHWHRFFCLFPRTVHTDSDGYETCVWLGYCERIGKYYTSYDDWGWEWEYREIKKED